VGGGRVCDPRSRPGCTLATGVSATMGRYVTDNLVSSYCNLAQMARLAGAFVLLLPVAKRGRLCVFWAPYGRMSLTCYVTQGWSACRSFYATDWR